MTGFHWLSSKSGFIQVKSSTFISFGARAMMAESRSQVATASFNTGSVCNPS